jgi:hypothetical protein
VSNSSTGLSDAELSVAAVSPKKAAALLDVSLSTIYSLINRQEVVRYLAGDNRRITVSSIRAYQDRCCAASNTPDGPLKNAKADKAAPLGTVAARQKRRERAAARQTSVSADPA